jgi:aspartate 1-decarboxylase
VTGIARRVTMASLMLTRLLKAKIHHAVVTRTHPEYHGSITIDRELLRMSGLLPYEAVLIADCENANRFETYIIPGEAGSGVIEINGAAAKLSAVGNRVIIMSFVLCSPEEVQKHQAKVLVMNPDNTVKETVFHRAMEG